MKKEKSLMEFGKPERKIIVSVCIDENLNNKLRELKKDKKIKTLSPVINELIKRWLEEEAEKKKGDPNK